MSAMLPSSSSENFWNLPYIRKPSLGGGNVAMSLDRQLRKMLSPPPSSQKVSLSNISTNGTINLNERLFGLTGELKILVSKVSMHLPDEWRKILFRKLDQLNDPDNWDVSDTLIEPSSFMTFLRLVLQLGPIQRASLGVSANGHLLAGWRRDKDSLTLEFTPDNQIRWTVVQHIGEKIESAAGSTDVTGLAAVLAPYDSGVWFFNANTVSS